MGFFGFDDSTGKFTFVPDATDTSSVISGTKGNLDIGGLDLAGSITSVDGSGEPNCANFVAGIIQGILNSAKLFAKVTAHTVAVAATEGQDQTASNPYMNTGSQQNFTTMYVIKFSADVLQREA